MRDKLRALYYPDFWVNYPTFIKSILLFDEIHIMDRPSMTFDGQHLTIGAASPIRQYEKSFRDEGVPLYVHEPPSGPVLGEVREVAEADLADLNFMMRFQEGLKVSPYFRNLHIQPGNYGNNETHETIFQKLVAIDLRGSPSAIEIHNNRNLRPFDFSNLDGTLKTLVSAAAFCSAKMNFALTIGVREGFSPFADFSPYAGLLSAKYSRAIASESAPVGRRVAATDLSLSILDELVPSEVLSAMTIDDAIMYRRASESAREAFMEHLLGLQAKLGAVPESGDYTASIEKIITTEIRPAARTFANKLEAIYEKFLGKLKGAAVLAACSPAAIQIFGDITLEKLISLVVLPGGAFVIKEGIEALQEHRATTRECALTYLLNIEA